MLDTKRCGTSRELLRAVVELYKIPPGHLEFICVASILRLKRGAADPVRAKLQGIGTHDTRLAHSWGTNQTLLDTTTKWGPYPTPCSKAMTAGALHESGTTLIGTVVQACEVLG